MSFCMNVQPGNRLPLWYPVGAWLILAAGTAVGQTTNNAAPTGPNPGAVEAMLVKNALTAANHAVITGNFTVLRDLGSASFRQKNSAGDLAMIFKGLKDKRVDLSPILNMEPQFTEQPTIDQGFLRLIGYFPTQPLQVRFALAYQRTEAGWVLDAISVGAVDTRNQAPPTNTPPSAPPPTVNRPLAAAPSTPPSQPLPPLPTRPQSSGPAATTASRPMDRNPPDARR